MARAIAYVNDIALGRTGEVIKGSGQVEPIKRYAAGNGIEIVAWFEDETAGGDILKRPGIQALLACKKPYDLVLCDRVWALSRSMASLEPFFRELDRRGAGFESATPTWDCVSQQCRRRSKSQPILPRSAQLPDEIGEFVRYRVARPARLNFVNLVHRAPPSMSPRL